MLDCQVDILSCDTGDFYSNTESRLHNLNHKVRSERNKLTNELNIIAEKLIDGGFKNDDLDKLINDDLDLSDYDDKVQQLCDEYLKLKEYIDFKKHIADKSKNQLLKLLSNKVKVNIESNGRHHLRKLNSNNISEKNIISVFNSSLIRMLGVTQDEFTNDFLVVQVYYFDIMKDILLHGFHYENENYVFFTASAGQIRTKKLVFIKESVWNKYEKTIMCGLTLDIINSKGGNNPNKHLAYMALTNSATDLWDDFDIDKTIVIDDFETEVYGTYDLIDDEDYSIKRITGYVPINHTDGVGLILNGKNRMVRLPWMKGLLGHCNYIKFIKNNGCSPIIKDIYGKEHNIIDENIQIIFTKSQFKMWKYYDSWEQYKEFFKKYHCTAGYANMESDKIKNSTINYQMLQTLTDFTDDEIIDIASSSINKLNNICSSIDSLKRVFGITAYNTDKTYLQKSIDIYPDLMKDRYLKRRLKEIKDNMVKQYRAGHLDVNGKYTFILPDFYAACEYWFLGIKNPDGLLKDKEVFCRLFKNSEKLDCLRSPHLYVEHAVRSNRAYLSFTDETIQEWFDTDAVYTSCHDLISKVLQFDVDGDMALVVSDKTLIEVAERNTKNIVPLYYNMRKAEPKILTKDVIYEGLKAAFVGGNIGIYSNAISKIWNSDVFLSGSDEDKQSALNTIKYLCMENNFVID